MTLGEISHLLRDFMRLQSVGAIPAHWRLEHVKMTPQADYSAGFFHTNPPPGFRGTFREFRGLYTGDELAQAFADNMPVFPLSALDGDVLRIAVRQFLREHPLAMLVDVMAEFDLSATEARIACNQFLDSSEE